MSTRVWVMLGVSVALCLAVVAVSTTSMVRSDHWQLDRHARTVSSSGVTIVASQPLVWIARQFDIDGFGILTLERPVEGPLPAGLIARLQLEVARTGGLWREANAVHGRGPGFSGPSYLVVVTVERDGTRLSYSAGFTADLELTSFVVHPEVGAP